MKWKPRLQRLISPFISATLVLLLLLCFAYPAMLMEAKEQRQNDIRLQVDQIARSFEQSVLNIVTALIEMESLPRNCSPYVQRKFYFYHAGLSQVSEFSLFSPSGELICSSWQTAVVPAEEIRWNSGESKIHIRTSAMDSLQNQVGIYIARRAKDGYENAAFLPMVSLRDAILSLIDDYQFLGLVDAKTGVPVVLKGKYSLPLNLDRPLFPMAQVKMLEGRGDNLHKQFWYAKPLRFLPQLVLMISVDSDQLYHGIYMPGWQWWLLLLILQALLTLLFVFLKLRASDPKRQLVMAMNQKQFFNVYQPIVDARNGSLSGVEVLLRWQHPVAGLINPAEFIPMAESTGVIVPLTIQQLANVEREMAPLLRLYPKLHISLNIGAQHLSSATFITQLLAYKAALPGLNVEITESEIMAHEDPVLLTTLHKLRQQQFSIAIDDFGTGYSSLGYLQSLPVSLLKIDRSFVATIGTSAVNAPVLEAIILLSQNLDIEMIAEGVETPEQAEWLVRHGVWRHQGWLYARAERIDALLRMHWPVVTSAKLTEI